MYNLESFIIESKQAEEWLGRELSQISTGRATPVLLDGVKVESYGISQSLKNVASVSIEDPKTLLIVPWDKGLIKDIERGIYASDLGFSVTVNDSGIRIIIPQLTEERRTQLAKLAKEKMEEARIAIRKARENMTDKIKELNLPEDTAKRAKEELQAKVDLANRKLEEIYKNKETEITTQ